MKRTALVLSLILIISALFVPAVYADGTLIAANGLQIVSTTPRDGETGKQPQNMAVKFATYARNNSGNVRIVVTGYDSGLNYADETVNIIRISGGLLGALSCLWESGEGW